MDVFAFDKSKRPARCVDDADAFDRDVFAAQEKERLVGSSLVAARALG